MKTEQEAIEIRRVYTETGGNVSETARICGCGRGTVRRALVRDYGDNGGRKLRRRPQPEDAIRDSCHKKATSPPKMDRVLVGFVANREMEVVMTSLMDITGWFLTQESMTHKKLQKLCYYAQAWYCTLYDGVPLFKERIEAWVHGPVIPALYPHFADYRWEKIPQLPRLGEFSFTPKEKRVLEAVYRTYGRFSGDELERLTHSELPWIQARGNLRPWEPCTTEITTDSMRAYYSKKYEQTQND